jgi:SAM-dependent methyltransferase
VGSVLDFGCGCGRVAIWWRDYRADFFGCDIDAEAIGWAAANLPGRFTVNNLLPPLTFPNATFDLVYSISVFTHLSEEHQDLWLAELRRVTKPGGVAILSVHSKAANTRLPASVRRTLERHGIAFVPTWVFRSVFPSAYQVTYHTRAYIEARWPRFFDVLGYEPFGQQDLVILRRPHD